jgi:hypothetical protein
MLHRTAALHRVGTPLEGWSMGLNRLVLICCCSLMSDSLLHRSLYLAIGCADPLLSWVQAGSA